MGKRPEKQPEGEEPEVDEGSEEELEKEGALDDDDDPKD